MLQRTLVLIVSTFIFCSNPSSDNRIDSAKAKWEKASTGNYSFVFSYNCHCPAAYTGPFKIWVKNERIDSMFNRTELFSVPDSIFYKYLTIAQSFHWIDSMGKTNPTLNIVEFDETMGYPKKADFDWETVGADGGVGFTIDSVDID